MRSCNLTVRQGTHGTPTYGSAALERPRAAQGRGAPRGLAQVVIGHGVTMPIVSLVGRRGQGSAWSIITALTSPHLTSPHLTSPHLTSPHLTSPHLTSPHLTSPHLTSPHLTSPHLTSPHLTSPHLTSPHLTSPHLTSPHLTSPPLPSHASQRLPIPEPKPEMYSKPFPYTRPPQLQRPDSTPSSH